MDTETKILQVITDITHVQNGDTSIQVKLVDKDGKILLVLEKN